MKFASFNSRAYVAGILLAAVTTNAYAQALPQNSTPVTNQPASSQGGADAKPAGDASQGQTKLPSNSERRRAAKLYLSAAKLYGNQDFEHALEAYQRAASLDPTNHDYPLAAQVARSHAVAALIQTAARDRTRGDLAGARAALAHALELDPNDPLIAQHLRGLGDDVAARTNLSDGLAGPRLGEAEQIKPAGGVHSFHLRSGQRQIIQQVFRAYGIDATLDDSVRGTLMRFDLDDVSFAEAMRVLAAVTQSFYVPIDAHRVLVARDTRELRQQYIRNSVETVYLSGLTAAEMTEIGNMARNIFEMPQTVIDPAAGTLTVRAPEKTLAAFNATFRELTEGRSQVLIDVRVIQLAHSDMHNTGVQPPQTVTAYNVYAEEQSILNANQDLVQQIIASGLAAPGDTLTILGILLASGQISSSFLSNGLALFGGGLTLSGLSPSPTTFNLNLNSSDSRTLDNFQLRLQDGEDGTLKSGTRYPIMTSSYSNLGGNSINIPGLTNPGNSSNLSGLLSSLSGAATTIPQVEYQDLGLTLKATPRVLRSGDVALTLDMKISALAGASINSVPVLANRAYSAVITARHNEAVVIASEIDSQESRAISGLPGLSEIPGLNDVSEKNTQKNTSTLLIMLTPHVISMPHGLGHSPMMRVERTQTMR